MSLPLIDARIKITPETDAVLEAMSRDSGRDRSEIAREWLHGIALVKIRASIGIQDQLRRKEIVVEDQGGRGISQFADVTL